MSTHSMIARKTDMGYDCIYVHNDGYVDGVGKALREVFNTDEDVLDLISLGDCSSVARANHVDDAVAFCRDRGEDWEGVKPMCFATVVEAIDYYDTQFHYVWEDDKWSVFNGRGELLCW